MAGVEDGLSGTEVPLLCKPHSPQVSPLDLQAFSNQKLANLFRVQLQFGFSAILLIFAYERT